MFNQKSFYPLYPPRMPHDIQLINEYCTINRIPNIMVVPSEMKYFMRVRFFFFCFFKSTDFDWFIPGHQQLFVHQSRPLGGRINRWNIRSNHRPTSKRGKQEHYQLSIRSNCSHLNLFKFLIFGIKIRVFSEIHGIIFIFIFTIHFILII